MNYDWRELSLNHFIFSLRHDDVLQELSRKMNQVTWTLTNSSWPDSVSLRCLWSTRTNTYQEVRGIKRCLHLFTCDIKKSLTVALVTWVWSRGQFYPRSGLRSILINDWLKLFLPFPQVSLLSCTSRIVLPCWSSADTRNKPSVYDANDAGSIRLLWVQLDEQRKTQSEAVEEVNRATPDPAPPRSVPPGPALSHSRWIIFPQQRKWKNIVEELEQVVSSCYCLQYFKNTTRIYHFISD